MNYIRFTLAICLLSLGLNATLLAGGPKLSEGSKLIYGVDYYGDLYDFEVTVKEIGYEIKFDYQMTKSGMKGSVHITSTALHSALGQHNYFQGGEVKLTTKTSVWVSQLVYTGLKKNGKVTIDLGEGPVTLNNKEAQKMDVKVDGKVKQFKVLYCETGEGEKMWITDDKKYPMILKMDLGWLIWIKEIKS